MAETLGAILDRRPELGGVVFDVLSAQQVQRTQEITRFPVESGATISDHVIKNPIVISLRGEIGNVSLSGLKAATFNAQEAYDKLVELYEKNELIDYQTGFELFENMIFTSLTSVDELNKAGAFVFDAVLEEIRITQAEQVAIPAEILEAGKVRQQLSSPINRGQQELQPVTEPILTLF